MSYLTVLRDGKGEIMTYTMNDLGYQGTPTTALYRVEMEDGSKWDTPKKIDWQEGWCNGEKEIIGDL